MLYANIEIPNVLLKVRRSLAKLKTPVGISSPVLRRRIPNWPAYQAFDSSSNAKRIDLLRRLVNDTVYVLTFAAVKQKVVVSVLRAAWSKLYLYFTALNSC